MLYATEDAAEEPLLRALVGIKAEPHEYKPGTEREKTHEKPHAPYIEGDNPEECVTACESPIKVRYDDSFFHADIIIGGMAVRLQPVMPGWMGKMPSGWQQYALKKNSLIHPSQDI